MWPLPDWRERALEPAPSRGHNDTPLSGDLKNAAQVVSSSSKQQQSWQHTVPINVPLQPLGRWRL